MTEQKNIYSALLAFQAEAPMILKTANNPFYKSKYADLPAVWGTIKDMMARYGFVVLNSVKVIDGRDMLETVLFYTPSGEILTSCLPINPAKNDPQGYGAAITYHRRQNLVTLLGLVCDDDDDGNEASGTKEKKAEKPKVEQKPDPELTPAQKKAKEFLEKCSRELKAVTDLATLEMWEGLEEIKAGRETISLAQKKWLQDKINEVKDRLNPLNAG